MASGAGGLLKVALYVQDEVLAVAGTEGVSISVELAGEGESERQGATQGASSAEFGGRGSAESSGEFTGNLIGEANSEWRGEAESQGNVMLGVMNECLGAI